MTERIALAKWLEKKNGKSALREESLGPAGSDLAANALYQHWYKAHPELIEYHSYWEWAEDEPKKKVARSKYLIVRMTEGERDRISQMAAAKGKTMSDFIRMEILK